MGPRSEEEMNDVRLIDSRNEDPKLSDYIAVLSRVYTQRCFNYIVGYYKH